jgi:FixJ family two-component response regulator
MNKTDCKVFLIDDDTEVRDSLSLLLKSADYKVETFQSVEQFTEQANYTGAGCILLDIYLGEKSGLELQEEIEAKYDWMPIIIITGFGNISITVEAFKKGAINFLEKPIDESKLLAAIEEALNKSSALVAKHNEIDRIKSLISSLTAREYEIFKYVITGLLNKQIASELGIAEHTVKNHRLKVTEKLGVKSVPELIYMAEKLGINFKS